MEVPKLHTLVPKILFEVFHNRSEACFSLKFEEHVKTTKNRCLETKKDISRENVFEKVVFSWRVSLEGFPRGLPCLISCEKC